MKLTREQEAERIRSAINAWPSSIDIARRFGLHVCAYTSTTCRPLYLRLPDGTHNFTESEILPKDLAPERKE